MSSQRTLLTKNLVKQNTHDTVSHKETSLSKFRSRSKRVPQSRTRSPFEALTHISFQTMGIVHFQ